MKYIKKFNEEFISPYASDEEKAVISEEKRKHVELKEAKIKIYESMNPSMIEVFEDWSDYLLELTDKYGEATSPYGDVRDIIGIGGLHLEVDIDEDSDYKVATEKDYIHERGNKVKKDPRNIPTEKKLSMYGSNFDWNFLDYYKKHNGQVNPFYSFMIAFDSDYKNGRLETWSEEDIQEMTQELVDSVKIVLKRLGAKIVKLDAYDPREASSNSNTAWSEVVSKNLDDIKYPRFEVGFSI